MFNRVRAFLNSSKGLNIWKSYCHLLEKRPLVTKSVTSGILSLGADIISQTNEQYAKTLGDYSLFEYDIFRFFRFSLLGAAFVGPVLHGWYGLLNQRFPGAHLLPIVQRLALDQLVFAPLFIPSFFACNLLLEGRPEKISDKLRADWFSTVFANWSLWVPSQFINFKFIPPQFNVLFSNSVGFVWNIYLSSVTYRTIVVSPISSLKIEAPCSSCGTSGAGNRDSSPGEARKVVASD